MAGSISFTFQGTHTPNNSSAVPDSIGKKELTVTQTNENSVSKQQTIGTTEETVDIGADIATLGYIFIQSLEASGGNFVDVGLTGSYPIRLQPGQFAVFPGNGTLYALADTADVKIQIVAYEL